RPRVSGRYEARPRAVPEGSPPAVTSPISKPPADLIEAQARRISLEAALKQITQLKDAGQPLDAVPQFATDSTIVALSSQIAQANNDLTRLRQQFKEGHPEIQKLRLQIEQSQKAKDKQGIQIVAAMRAEYEQLQ